MRGLVSCNLVRKMVGIRIVGPGEDWYPDTWFMRGLVSGYLVHEIIECFLSLHCANYREKYMVTF